MKLHRCDGNATMLNTARNLAHGETLETLDVLCSPGTFVQKLLVSRPHPEQKATLCSFDTSVISLFSKQASPHTSFFDT